MTATRPPGYDDRSAAPVEASRRGAHRARPKAVAAILPVIAGFAVVVLVIGAVYTVAGNRGDTKNSAAGQSLSEDEDTKATPAASASASADAGGAAGDDTGTGSDAEETTGAEDGDGTGSGTDETASDVDKSTKLVVLNSLGVAGLAGKYQDQLEGEGWTVSRTDNSANRDLPVSKIYYNDAASKATAQAVKKSLGLGELSLNASVNPGFITVVLGSDTQ
ncbi:LytR C-terminal domain-containing protein [Kineosporia succinea]|uniref:LytR/CpsA/Psr regulator C-terminal domain-containing protein n=1 Tax=Kineosporia succinea TaxID=84632 RepID=A0ABT9NZT8_9ACTN|nr:LytR C-terminal domain-containing protein [Kineosporia succinea]MDP9825942.1 hypothetical protein [Kineosporia succinea]